MEYGRVLGQKTAERLGEVLGLDHSIEADLASIAIWCYRDPPLLLNVKSPGTSWTNFIFSGSLSFHPRQNETSGLRRKLWLCRLAGAGNGERCDRRLHCSSSK